MNILVLIIIGISAMLVLAVGIIGFVMMYQRRVIYHQLEIKKINEQKQRDLLHAAIQSEEKERMRIASELHDDVAVTLASVKLFIARAATTANTEMINQSKELLNESIDKIRSISHSLQPATLQYLGLQTSLQAYMETLQKTSSIQASFTANSTIEGIDDNLQLNIYRIVQELTNNILKHAHAHSIATQLIAEEDKITISVVHDGQGLTQESFQEMVYKKGATGLKNIVNRLKYIKGTISFYTEADNQFHTVVIIPLMQEAALNTQ